MWLGFDMRWHDKGFTDTIWLVVAVGGSRTVPLEVRWCYSGWHGGSLVVRVLQTPMWCGAKDPWTNRCRCPTWISYSILSLRVLECPLFLWYRHRFLQSTFSRLDVFLGGGISSALRASSRILPLSVVKGVYLENRLPRLSLRLPSRLADRP